MAEFTVLEVINLITSIRPSRMLFAATMIALGLTGVVNGEVARGHQIIPIQDFPGLTAFAYATAIIEVSVFPRLAATMEALMLGLITVLYCGPALPTGQTATTAFVISALIAAGVWLVADSWRNVPWLTTGRAGRGVSND